MKGTKGHDVTHPQRGIFPTSGKITAKSLIGKTLEHFFCFFPFFFSKPTFNRSQSVRLNKQLPASNGKTREERE
jgi:hypothetical protein